MDLELRHLRTLCAIAEARSIRGAAKALGATQPALSTQLARIERSFGAALFERTANGAEPTVLGDQVVRRAREILDDTRSLVKLAAPDNHETTERLVIASTITPVLAPLVSQLRETTPHLDITVYGEYSTSRMMERIERDELNVALVVDYPGHELRHSPALDHRVIASEPTFVAMSEKHPLAHKVEVSLSELADDAWFVTPDDGAGWPGVFHEAWRSTGYTPRTTHEFLGRDQVVPMVAAGVGVFACQATMLPTEGLVVRPLSDPPLWCRYLIVWRHDRVHAGLAERLHRLCLTIYRDLAAKSPAYRTWVHQHGLRLNS